MRKKAGFSMIELVVACLIVGVILAVGIPSFFKSAETAKCRQAMQTLKAMSTAAFDFYAENETFAGLTVDTINAQAGVYVVNNDDWNYGAVGDAAGFTLTAIRQRGPHGAGSTIIFDEDYTRTGTYPADDPGNF